MDLFQILIFAGIGLLTGFISGLFGIGGGSIRIPLLSFAGMSLIGAFATNMFSIPFSSSIGAYVQKKNINWKVIKSFTIGATAGIIVATFLIYFIPTNILAIIFFISAMFTIIGLYLDKISLKIYNSLKPTKTNLFWSILCKYTNWFKRRQWRNSISAFIKSNAHKDAQCNCNFIICKHDNINYCLTHLFF
jgi:uncharacterized protein